MGRRGRRRRRCREPRRGERGAGDDLAGEERSIAAMGVGVDRQAPLMRQAGAEQRLATKKQRAAA